MSGFVLQSTTSTTPAPCFQLGVVNFTGSGANLAGSFDQFAAATHNQLTQQPVQAALQQASPLQSGLMQLWSSTLPTQWPAPSGATGMSMPTGKSSAFAFVNTAPQPSMPSKPAQMSINGPLPPLAGPTPDPLAMLAPREAGQMFDPFAPVGAYMQSAAKPMCVRA